jgi:hypothetical protein
MAVHCPFCKSFDLGGGFDGYQCFSCGGHMKMDGSPTVPTSALETEQSVYSGPGEELIADPTQPPFRAKDPVR